MTAIIQFNGTIATITDGVWKSDDIVLQIKLQRFRDSLEGLKYALHPDQYDGGDARGAVELLGGDAVILYADEFINSDDGLDENGLDENGMPRIY
ncbi:MAG: hypothetical protein LC099_06870 [Anaerolineales bacterium]|nr:hypothetical protein [Anaerolineales bacterium]